LPSFVAFLSFLVPLIAIGLGFDSVNGEHNQRTMSRILSQPIYRDALLFGKFLAGLFTLSISLVALWLLVIGLGLYFLGVPPNAEEVTRSFVFLLVVIAYAGVWLALAMLFSIIFRSAATAALVTLGATPSPSPANGSNRRSMWSWTRPSATPRTCTAPSRIWTPFRSSPRTSSIIAWSWRPSPRRPPA